jgi:hypothetical protein
MPDAGERQMALTPNVPLGIFNTDAIYDIEARILLSA